jgi:protein phosphatase
MEKNTLVQSADKTPNLVGVIVRWRVITHQGLMRSQNEDAHCVAHTVEVKTESESASRYLFAVADGLGGHRGGAIASRMALKSVKEEFHKWHGGGADRLVDRALQQANQNVFCVAQSDPELFHKMQTTLTVVALDNDSLTIGHVGDCRLYRLREGRLELLTRDHTMANDMLQIHLISIEQASQHPGRHQLTRSVGGEPFMKADITRERTQPGDTYLLCSDGLWSELTPEDIQVTIRENDVSSACDKLVRLALRGGAPDNITAIMFRIETIGTRASRPLSGPLADFDKSVRSRAALALASISKVAIEPFSAKMKEPKWETRYRAAGALGKIADTNVVQPVVKALRDNRDHVRYMITKRLRQQGDSKATEPLVILLKDENRYFRMMAARGLGAMGGKNISEELKKALAEEQDDKVKEVIRKALKSCDLSPVAPLND